MNSRNRTTAALALFAGILLANATPSHADLIDGLVEYWELNGDYSAGITAEHVGTLQAKGTGLTESGFVPGKFDQGIDLESSDASNQASVVIGGDENDFDFTGGSMSLSIWYTTESLYRDWQTLAGKGENASWRLARNRTTASQLKISLWLVGEGELDQQDGSWHHAVAVIDASGHYLYVDGSLVASNANPGNLAEGSLPMQIGGNPQAANRGWDGIIDDVGIWDRALTADEIASIWNDGTGASIASLIGVADASKPQLDIDQVGGDLVISWDSQAGMLYNLRSETDLSTPDPASWPIYDGNMDLAATPPTNTLSIPLPADPSRYFVIEEFPAPPVTTFSDDFESGQGAWTMGSDGAVDTEWQLGTPTVVGPLTTNSGVNCFGTNLDSDYANDADVWLRSPAIDLTGASAATLGYAEFRDIEAMFDSGTVNVLDAADDSLLAEVESGVEGSSTQWDPVSHQLPAEALGKVIKIEFRLNSDNFNNLAGWYIDDVVVTTPAP